MAIFTTSTSELKSSLRPSAASPRPEAVAAADPPNPAPRVWACVVCYHPDLRAIARLVDTVGPEVDCILLLDNAPEASEGLAGLAGPRIRHVPMTGNRGTAGAMNAAWQEALIGGAELMVSFDQDSIPVAGLVGGLVATFRSLTQQGIAVAAVGPLKTDPRTGQTMRVVLPGGFTKSDASARTTPIDVDHLVSSGCLISRGAFQAVGPFNESLFLDYVDIEWCLRARGAGYGVLCEPRLLMGHVIGDGVVRIASRSVWVHQPARSGMLVRNHLLLWRSPAMTRAWMANDALHVGIKLAVQLCVRGPRGQRLIHIARGVRDGLRGKGGPP